MAISSNCFLFFLPTTAPVATPARRVPTPPISAFSNHPRPARRDEGWLIPSPVRDLSIGGRRYRITPSPPLHRSIYPPPLPCPDPDHPPHAIDLLAYPPLPLRPSNRPSRLPPTCPQFPRLPHPPPPASRPPLPSQRNHGEREGLRTQYPRPPTPPIQPRDNPQQPFPCLRWPATTFPDIRNRDRVGRRQAIPDRVPRAHPAAILASRRNPGPEPEHVRSCHQISLPDEK